ncbi:hypothetical protein LguiA_034692 [Lonicera macranthoides]
MLSTTDCFIISANEELLLEILLRLPVKSLLRFKSVSKQWHNLITSTYFSRRRYSCPFTPSGLLLHPLTSNFVYHLDFIPLHRNENENPIDYNPLTATPPTLSGLKILHSCNGLLSCYTKTENNQDRNYYVYNPTTKQSVLLPRPGEGAVQGMLLAFDPSKSLQYKVVCVWNAPFDQDFQIKIYSSETRCWRASGGLVNSEYINFRGGVYWNGSINWISFWGDSLYFNVDEERLGVMPMLPVVDGRYERPFRYFGNSRDHLHLIEIYPPMTEFNVYEMNRDYSRWFVKYRVDLAGVVKANPRMIQNECGLMDEQRYAFFLLTLVREEIEDKSFLVLNVPGKVICYNFADKTFKTLCDSVPLPCDYPWSGVNRHLRYGGWFDTFEYIESLSSV